MIPIASYHAPTIVVGDYAIRASPDAQIRCAEGYLKLGINSVWPCITNSTLYRAVQAGATIGLLSVSHRQRGDLTLLPSNPFYNGQMETSKKGQKKFPGRNIRMARIFAEIVSSSIRLEREELGWTRLRGGSLYRP